MHSETFNLVSFKFVDFSTTQLCVFTDSLVHAHSNEQRYLLFARLHHYLRTQLNGRSWIIVGVDVENGIYVKSMCRQSAWRSVKEENDSILTYRSSASGKNWTRGPRHSPWVGWRRWSHGLLLGGWPAVAAAGVRPRTDWQVLYR